METKNSLAVPAAIVIAGVVVAGAIIYGMGKSKVGQVGVPGEDAAMAGALDKMRPVDATDHLRGNIDAPVTIVEYSDTECPFCKRFHETMKEVVKKYDGKVAWVYRHFPLKELHAKAFNEAKAMECAAKIGGANMFWQYTDALYTATPSNDQLDPAELPRIAGNLKLDRQKFADCLASDDVDAAVTADLEDAMATGGNGTPWSILVTKSGTKYAINGAQPLENLVQMIDMALAEEK